MVTTLYGAYPHTDAGVEVGRVFHKLRSSAIEHFNLKAGKRGSKSRLLPRFNGNVVVRGSGVVILRQSSAVTPHIRAAQMKYPHIESFDAVNLALDVRNR